MAHSADGVARQPGVGVERHDVANICGYGGRLAVATQERGAGPATQELVELMQLAALALPAEPAAFALVPHPPAMQQQEAVAALMATARG